MLTRTRNEEKHWKMYQNFSTYSCFNSNTSRATDSKAMEEQAILFHFLTLQFQSNQLKGTYVKFEIESQWIYLNLKKCNVLDTIKAINTRISAKKPSNWPSRYPYITYQNTLKKLLNVQ